MVLSLTFFCLLLSVSLVSGHLLSEDQTTRRPRKGDSEEKRVQDRQKRSISSQGNYECQEGFPLGATYSGKMNVTISGRTCQEWTTSQPHEHPFTDVGEHNYCRNPSGTHGVWCHSTDPDKLWEHCSVPLCDPTYNCQEGDPLGVSYVGPMTTTTSGRTCKAWAGTTLPLGEHNYCRNPVGHPDGVFCFTTDPEKPWDHCSVPRCVSNMKVLDFSADNDQQPDSKVSSPVQP